MNQKVKKFFENKIVCITGAGSGMGRDMALFLAKAGAELFICDYNKETLQEVSSSIEKTGAVFHSHTTDVSDEREVEKWITTIKKETSFIDILINNAGIAGKTADLDLMTVKEMRQVVDVNLWGAVYCTMKSLELLKKSSCGQVVNVSSLAGIAAVLGALSYTISKFAIRGFSEALTFELMEQNISVSQVFPGVVKTNIVQNIPGFNREDAVKSQEKFNRQKGISSEEAAEIILTAVSKKKPRIFVGPNAVVMDKLVRVFPGIYFKLVYGQMKKIINELK